MGGGPRRVDRGRRRINDGAGRMKGSSVRNLPELYEVRGIDDHRMRVGFHVSKRPIASRVVAQTVMTFRSIPRPSR